MTVNDIFNNGIPSIGIISGAGPEAGLTLNMKIVNQFQQHGAWEDNH